MLYMTQSTDISKDWNMGENDNSQAQEKMHIKIRKTWSNLNLQDINLYETDRMSFLVKLHEKQNVSRQEGERQLARLEKECGYNTSPYAQKNCSTKVA